MNENVSAGIQVSSPDSPLGNSREDPAARTITIPDPLWCVCHCWCAQDQSRSIQRIRGRMVMETPVCAERWGIAWRVRVLCCLDAANLYQYI